MNTSQTTPSCRGSIAAGVLGLPMVALKAGKTSSFINEEAMRPYHIMKTVICILRLTCIISVSSLIASLAHAGPGVQHWTTLRHEAQFKELKSGDKVAFVCTQCKAISTIPVQSSEQATKLGKDGASVACPTCHRITKVIVRASRKDLYAPPVVTYVNDKGEEVAFLAIMGDPK